MLTVMVVVPLALANSWNVFSISLADCSATTSVLSAVEEKLIGSSLWVYLVFALPVCLTSSTIALASSSGSYGNAVAMKHTHSVRVSRLWNRGRGGLGPGRPSGPAVRAFLAFGPPRPLDLSAASSRAIDASIDSSSASEEDGSAAGAGVGAGEGASEAASSRVTVASGAAASASRAAGSVGGV